MVFFPFLTACVMVFCGLAAIRRNPRRPANLALGAVCLVSAVSVFLQVVARYRGAQFLVDGVSNPLPWVRARYSAIAFLNPFLLWLCFYAISGRYAGRWQLFRKLAWPAVGSLVLAVFPFFQAFKPDSSLPGHIVNGPLYTVYFAAMLFSTLGFAVAGSLFTKHLRDVRRLEFQFITLTFGYMSMGVVALNLLDVFVPGIPYLETVNQTLSIVVFLLYAASSWGVTTPRVYHSAEIFGSLAVRIASVGVVAIVTLYLLRWLGHYDHSAASAAAVLVGAFFAFYALDQRVKRWFVGQGQPALIAETACREAWANEPDTEKFLEHCEKVLTDLTGANVKILAEDFDRFETEDFVILKREARGSLLMKGGAISLSAVTRANVDPVSASIAERMAAKSVALLVSPHDYEPNLLVAVHTRENEIPFTYPEIERLRTVVELIDSLYTRSRFALQARQAEQLAMIGLIGAGLAHELRNPVVAISTFAQLLPRKMHDEKFLRDFAAVLPGETARIQKLAESLLDLAKPRSYEFRIVDLNAIVRDTCMLLNERARKAGISLQPEFQHERAEIHADGQAIRQVALNLGLNAIQVLSEASIAGTVYLRTGRRDGVMVLAVEDNGPGISEKARAKLFRPFSSGGKKGIGLGLAVSAEIMKVHRGTIDCRNAPTGGAVFEVTLPVADSNELNKR